MDAFRRAFCNCGAGWWPNEYRGERGNAKGYRIRKGRARARFRAHTRDEIAEGIEAYVRDQREAEYARLFAELLDLEVRRSAILRRLDLLDRP